MASIRFSFVAVALAASWAMPVGAVTFVVNSVADTTTCDAATCTLRGAILAANAAPGADVVQVPPGTYRITRPGGGEDASVSGDLDVLDAVTIRGGGSAITTIDGNGFDRVFDVLAPNVEISGMTIRGGDGVDGGGGLSIRGQGTRVVGATIRGNHARYQGGGIDVGMSASLDLADSSVSDNHADYAGGGIDSYGSLRVSGVTIESNHADYEGGGINLGIGSLVLQASVVRGNAAGYGGGGIELQSSWLGQATAAISGSEISGNHAAYEGGGISNYGRRLVIGTSTIADNRSDYSGGGIQNNGGLTVSDSTISGNQAGGAGGGGGVDNVTWWGGSATGSFVNVTLTGNRTTADGGGMAVFGGSVSLRNVTMAHNHAGGHGGGVAIEGGGSVYAANSLFSENGSASGSGADCAGSLTSSGHNLFEDLGGCAVLGDSTGNLVAPASLAPLGDYGGPTATHALLPESPARDAGDAADPGNWFSACAPADQRGIGRPQGVSCDLGAVEMVSGLAGRILKVVDPAGRPSHRKLQVLSKDFLVPSPQVDAASDPVVNGAQLEITNPLTGETDAWNLPATGWIRKGTRTYQYVDKGRLAGPCEKVVLVGGKMLKATCRGDQIRFSLDERHQGRLGVRFGLGGMAHRSCALFGGFVVADGPGIYVAKSAPAPSNCP